jgi:hypothetical protein
VHTEIDGDHSNRVDDGDLDVWRNHYGGGQPGVGALVSGSSVPEPTTFLLLLAGVGVASIHRGRRNK